LVFKPKTAAATSAAPANEKTVPLIVIMLFPSRKRDGKPRRLVAYLNSIIAQVGQKCKRKGVCGDKCPKFKGFSGFWGILSV
jgi:hypothetical protein